MHIATLTIKGAGFLIFSRYHNTEKLSKETPDAYEKRTWREKVHANEEGLVVVPGIAFKKCIQEAAKYLSIQIPGKGKSTYTKHFKAGFRSSESPLLLIAGKPVHKDSEQVQQMDLLVDSNGVSGSGKRVMRTFPYFSNWSVEASFMIVDDLITKDVFISHLESAGILQGIGSFRVGNGGDNGSFGFDPKCVAWEEFSLDKK